MTVGDIKLYLHCDGCGAPSLRSEVVEETQREAGTVRTVIHSQRVLWAARVLTRPGSGPDATKFPLVCSRQCLDAVRAARPLVELPFDEVSDVLGRGGVVDGRDVLLVVAQPHMPDKPYAGWFE